MSQRVGTTSRNGAADEQPSPGATHALTSALERIAALHGDLAEAHEALAAAYDDLAREAENGLAGLGNRSLYVPVPEQPDPFLTPEQTAEILQVHPRTLRRMELEGEVPPAVGEGKRKRWRRAEIEGLAAP